MKKGLVITLTAIALFAGCYYVTCYVNIFLGLFAIGFAVHILDKLTMTEERGK